MGRLMYSLTASLDGYVADREGKFDWAEPDEEVHTFVNDLERGIVTYVYGRRLYEVMSAWEDLDLEGLPSFEREFAELWRAADKVVYSSTLDRVETRRTILQREFDPEWVRRLKADTDGDLSIGARRSPRTLSARAWSTNSAS